MQSADLASTFLRPIKVVIVGLNYRVKSQTETGGRFDTSRQGDWMPQLTQYRGSMVCLSGESGGFVTPRQKFMLRKGRKVWSIPAINRANCINCGASLHLPKCEYCGTIDLPLAKVNIDLRKIVEDSDMSFPIKYV